MSKRGYVLTVVLAAIGSLLAWLIGGAATNGNASIKVHQSTVPQRIICAAPSITELVFALGQGERVVGVTDMCVHPPEGIKEKARIGGVYNPSRERILKLKPDLIIMSDGFDALNELAAGHGIPASTLRMDTLADIRAAIRKVGGLLGCPDAANSVLRSFDAELDAVRARVKPYRPRRVYLCMSHRPGNLNSLGTCGSVTFLSELLAIAGGSNVFADVKGAWPQVSKEALLKREPEVILEVQSGDMGVDAERFERLRRDWESLSELPAVRTGEVHFLTQDYLYIPSVRVPQIAMRMAEAIHPEAFRE